MSKNLRKFSEVISLTLSKIAKIANVSVSTASKVFSDSNEISDETKKKVIEVAKELGCFEKYNKISYDKQLIAIICPEVMGIHYSDMVTIIESIIRDKGGICLVSVTNFSADTQNALLDYYINFAKVDGIIIIDPKGTIDIDTTTPIVQVGHHNKYVNVYCVDVNICSALDTAISVLCQKGHRKIGYIGEKMSSVQYFSLRNGMEKQGLDLNRDFVVVNDKRFYDCGYWGMDELLKRDEYPTAVFLAYSHVAVGALQRLSEAEMKVPRDMSVICMDDIPITPYVTQKLSCIKMHIPELCYEAVRLLYHALEDKNGPTQVVTVTRQFCEGGTILDISNK